MNEIPIRNVYYLLCYAWRHFEEAELVAAEELDQFRHVHDVLGNVLATGVARLIQRGLDRDYRELDEEVAGIRGKLLIGATVRRTLHLRGRTMSRATELSHDVLHNRLIKSALGSLLQVLDLHDEVRSQVRLAYRSLSGAAEMRLSRRAFQLVQLDRNRRLYRFLLAISRLIFESRLVGTAEGEGRFFDFRRDERRMWSLFERFVAEFFRREQSQFNVNQGGRRVKWADPEGSRADLARLPRMKADVILESSARRIILDTKFYRRSLSLAGTLHSVNLYQLLAYLRNRQSSLPNGPRHEGVLLYPVVSEPLRVDVCLEGFRLQARGIDLSQPWKEVHKDLLAVVGL